MLSRIKSHFNSYLLIVVFVIPYLVYAKLSLFYKPIIDIILFLFYVLVAILLRGYLFKRKYERVFLFAMLFICFAAINQLFNGYFRVYNLVAPFAAFLGFVYVSEKTLSPRPFINLMLFNYTYFYLIYYSRNPLDFFIPEYDLNVEVFSNTSSNLIPVILIINLYVFDILNTVKFENKKKRVILLFSFLNVFLILLQRSRAGIFVSILFLFFQLFINYKKFSFIFLSIIIFLSYYYWPIIVSYTEAAGTMDSDSYSVDVRKENIDIFFNSMDSLKDILFGYGSFFEIMTVSATQNLAITIWNYYTIFPLLFVLILILLRVKKKNYLSITFYSVFISYSLFEGFFLSNYWDFIIYVLFFYKMKALENTNRAILQNYNAQ